MSKKIHIPKLLAPIRSYEGAVRVIRAGADEVYCDVFPEEREHLWMHRGRNCAIDSYDELDRVTKYAHSHDIPVILTLNEPFFTEAMEEEMANHVRQCLDKGIDAILVGDLGVLSMLKSMQVNVPLYASTYMVSMNHEAINFLEKVGFSRAVIERQLSTFEIKEIVEHSKIDVEVFVHGGGCSNLNGSCYLFHMMSPNMRRAWSAIDGFLKSPCKLLFDISEVDEENTVEDIPVMDASLWCSLCKLPELGKTGVMGFKIAGRCLSEEYQENTTKIYREFIDLITQDRMLLFNDMIELIKKEYFPLPPSLLNLQEGCCEEKRCYYSPLFYSPYKNPPSWSTWTKAQFKWAVLRE